MMTLVANPNHEKQVQSEKDSLICELLSGLQPRVYWMNEDPSGYATVERLRKYGVQVTWGQSLEQAMIQLGLEVFDLVVATESMPDGNCVSLLERYAEQQPIAVISDDLSPEKRARLFLMGVCEVVEAGSYKSEDLDFLVATLMFRQKRADAPQRQFGPVKACFDRHVISFDGEGVEKTLHLTSTEFRLLVLLLEGKGKVFQRSEILDHVWGGDLHVHTRTVDRHIAALRHKLKGSPLSIESVHGLGYRSEIQNHS